MGCRGARRRALGCSSKSNMAGSDRGRSDGGDGDSGPACGTCAISTPTCGVYEACGQLVNCGMCAFDSSALPYQSQSAFAASAPGGAIELAYLSQADFTVHVALRRRLVERQGRRLAPGERHADQPPSPRSRPTARAGWSSADEHRVQARRRERYRHRLAHEAWKIYQTKTPSMTSVSTAANAWTCAPERDDDLD